MRRLRWESPQRKVPRHPYRDSALLYAALAALVVVLAVLTGGDAARALMWAGAAFVIATGFSWWRWHRLLRRQEEQE